MTAAYKILTQALRLLLKPAARYCVRNSLRIQDVLEAAKVALLDAAQEEMESSGESVNVSRLSAMTGIHRRDVMRIFQRDEVIEKPQGTLIKIVGLWQQDSRFSNGNGRANVLSIEGGDAQFKKLVAAVSNDLHPSTVLFELERTGTVERVRDGVKLRRRAFVPAGDVVAGLSMMGDDAADLMNAVQENVFAAHAVPNLHAKTVYDCIDPKSVPMIREWLLREGSALHKRARAFIAKFDFEMNRKLKKCANPARAVLGTFSLIEEEAVAPQKESN